MQNENDPRGDDRAETRALVTALMARIVAGDDAALFEMMAAFGHRVRFKVLGILRDIGRHDLVVDDLEVDGMVTEAFIVIRDRAAGWRPDGGALPWNYAYRAVRARIYEVVGHRYVELDDGSFDDVAHADGASGPGSTPWHDLDAEQVLRDVARLVGDARLTFFLEVLRYFVSERDYEVVVEYLVQKYLDDPSPSQTVAGRLGLSDANVRQIASRTRRRLLNAIDDGAVDELADGRSDGLRPHHLLDIGWLGGNAVNGGDGVA